MVIGFGGVDIFTFLERKSNEEIWVFPKRMKAFGEKVGV